MTSDIPAEIDAVADATATEELAGNGKGGSERLELIATIVLAIATVLTAWSAFQSTKWGGVQANSYAQASAARTESAKAATRAGQETIVDVTTFEQWLNAVASEGNPYKDFDANGVYHPRPTELSGFIYLRFRPEFQAAFDAWARTNPINDTEAPKTPFAMPEYQLADQKTADRLDKEADVFGAKARQANQRSDNYVLLTVAFATALFFAGIGTKLRGTGSQWLAIGMSIAIMLGASFFLLTFPKNI